MSVANTHKIQSMVSIQSATKFDKFKSHILIFFGNIFVELIGYECGVNLNIYFILVGVSLSMYYRFKVKLW